MAGSLRRRLEVVFGGPARPFPLTVADASTLADCVSAFVEEWRETAKENPNDEPGGDSEILAGLHDLRQRLLVHAGYSRRPR